MTDYVELDAERIDLAKVYAANTDPQRLDVIEKAWREADAKASDLGEPDDANLRFRLPDPIEAPVEPEREP